MPCSSFIERRYMRPFSMSWPVLASSTFTRGAPGASGNATMALGSSCGASGSGGHADDDAGGGIAGAALASAVMHRPDGGAGVGDAVSAAFATTAVLVVAAGAGSGGVRLHPAVTS